MINCRPITSDEAPEYLELLCNVFDLDLSRASQVFYSEPFYHLTKKWALFQDGEMSSILSMTPLEFGWGKAVGIAGVATREAKRGFGLGQALLEAALEGAGPALLFAYKPTLYVRVGFQVVDEVISADLICDPEPTILDPLSMEMVKEMYTEWAGAHDARLRRNSERWEAWSWVYRPCESFRGGYLCSEPMLCREAVLREPADSWPVMQGSRWTGLKSLTSSLEVPILRPRHELLLMARNFPSLPQMFMTDQF